MDRIDVDEVKAGLLGAVSRETADEYWNCLSAFLSAKLTKFEFDCQVYSLLGSENGTGLSWLKSFTHAIHLKSELKKLFKMEPLKYNKIKYIFQVFFFMPA